MKNELYSLSVWRWTFSISGGWSFTQPRWAAAAASAGLGLTILSGSTGGGDVVVAMILLLAPFPILYFHLSSEFQDGTPIPHQLETISEKELVKIAKKAFKKYAIIRPPKISESEAWLCNQTK